MWTYKEEPCSLINANKWVKTNQTRFIYKFDQSDYVITTPISDVDKRVFVQGSFNLFLSHWMLFTTLFVHSYFSYLRLQFSNMPHFKDQFQPAELGRGKICRVTTKLGEAGDRFGDYCANLPCIRG